MFTTHLRGDKRVRPIVGVTTVSSVATILLAVVFLPAWGIPGAAGAYILGQAVAVPCSHSSVAGTG